MCIDGNWGSWAPWGSCSVSCGVGVVSRSRVCDNPPQGPTCGRPCEGLDSEAKSQRCGAEPVELQWSTWATWGQWIDMRGDARRKQRRRIRTCDDYIPGGCARLCTGSSFDTEICEGKDCPGFCVDGNWGLWTAWSRCSGECGNEVVNRKRVCDSPPSNECGLPCFGDEREEKSETCGPEPVDGNWATWNEWSECSATCGPGQHTRRRTCSNPPSNRCGRTCPGSSFESGACQAARCQVCMQREFTQWTTWSACSATCGRGTRRRARTCRVVRQGDDCGRQSMCDGGSGTSEDGVQLEDCVGLVRECPRASSYEFGEWANWCPCDCIKGKKSRRRTCQEVESSGRRTPVDVSFCQGDAREERYCDVRTVCPACIENCEGLNDGDYPSCSGCADYITCKNGQITPYTCSKPGKVFDGWISKCVTAPSPSCSLVVPITNCRGEDDGNYPSEQGCSYFVKCTRGQLRQEQCDFDSEYNHHLRVCESMPSPTCVRPPLDDLRNTAVIGGSITPVQPNDAPADAYYDEKHGLTPDQRREKYVKEKNLRDDELTEAKNAERLRLFTDKMKKLKQNNLLLGGQIVKTRRVNPNCVSDCDDVPGGRYPSCLHHGCSHYVICTKHGRMRQRKCHYKQEFDARTQRCTSRSSTCISK